MGKVVRITIEYKFRILSRKLDKILEDGAWLEGVGGAVEIV